MIKTLLMSQIIFWALWYCVISFICWDLTPFAEMENIERGMVMFFGFGFAISAALLGQALKGE